MKPVLAIAVAALMLSGCVVQWPSHRTGPRFTTGPNGSLISTAPTYAGVDAPGQIHGIGY
jgi:hypothetical protein